MKSKPYLIKTLLFCTLLAGSFTGLKAQMSVIGGMNYCNVVNHHLIKNQDYITTFHIGLSVQYYPVEQIPELSLKNELFVTRKGYQQQINRAYFFDFDYLATTILLNYELLENVSFHSGMELSVLYYSNVRKARKTYSVFDIGPVAGLTFFEKKNIGLYTRVTFGLIPMLDYYTFDRLGNFTGTIRDLHNLCFSAGIKLNFYNHEMHLK